MNSVTLLTKDLVDQYIEFKYSVDRERFKNPTRLSKQHVEKLYYQSSLGVSFGKRTYTYIYVENHTILGELRITITKNKCYIELVDMLKKLYSSNIFIALIDKAIELCKDNDLNKITVDLVFDDEIQTSAYKKRGFKLLGKHSTEELWDTYELTV